MIWYKSSIQERPSPLGAKIGWGLPVCQQMREQLIEMFKNNGPHSRTFSEVSSEMFSYGLRKTNVRKDLRLIHERQLFKSEDVRRVDMNVITNDFSQIQAFPLNAPSKAACTLPRQTPTFSNKRQQTPTVGSVCASSWCLLVIVGYCRKSSTCSVGLVKLQNVCPM